MTDLSASPMLSVVGVLCAVLYLLAACRLLCYRPNGARHRRGFSWAACLLIAATLCRAGQILLLGDHAGVPELLIAFLLCAGTWRVRGNLAALLRGDEHV